MPFQGAAEKIRNAAIGWPGVTAEPHRFGGIEFKLGDREIGHLHGDTLADIPFPRRVHDELIAAGRAEPHHILPESGWITFRISTDADVDAAIELFRRSFDLISVQIARRKAQASAIKQKISGPA